MAIRYRLPSENAFDRLMNVTIPGIINQQLAANERKADRESREKIQTDLQRMQQQELSKIRAIVESAIEEYAENNDFDIIMRADGTTLYAKSYINITQEIISKLQ